MTLVPHFTACAHSSSVYTNLNKLPLRQSLYLGLPVGLTKHLSAGTNIACRRVCKGDDLDDGLLMPKLSLIGDVVTRRQGWERKNFQYGGQTKNWKKLEKSYAR